MLFILSIKLVCAIFLMRYISMIGVDDPKEHNKPVGKSNIFSGMASETRHLEYKMKFNNRQILTNRTHILLKHQSIDGMLSSNTFRSPTIFSRTLIKT